MSRKFFVQNGYRILNPFRRLYWFIFRPHTRGAKCLVQHGDTFLLVRLTYAHKLWTIHGGRVNKDETFEAAALRETKEEVGISLESIEKIGTYKNAKEYKNDTVEVFYSKVDNSTFVIDEIEISEAGWFRLDELPADRVPRVDFIFDMLKKYEGY